MCNDTRAQYERTRETVRIVRMRESCERQFQFSGFRKQGPGGGWAPSKFSCGLYFPQVEHLLEPDEECPRGYSCFITAYVGSIVATSVGLHTFVRCCPRLDGLGVRYKSDNLDASPSIVIVGRPSTLCPVPLMD